MNEDIVFSNLLLACTAGVLIKHREKQSKRKRRWWVRPINTSQREQGDYYNIFREMKCRDHEQFFVYTRMTPEHFDQLLKMVEPFLRKSSPREPLCAELRLSLTLNYLSTGSAMQSVAWAYRVGASTTSCVIRETCEVLWKVLGQKYLKEPTTEDYGSIAREFDDRWNVPNCIGAIDGKHVVIQCPIKSGSVHFNYQKSFSPLLLAVCDARYRFTLINVGGYASDNDGGILATSNFGRALCAGTLGLPKEEVLLPNSAVKMPYFMIGSEAFPLRSDLMTPHLGQNLNEKRTIFNYRLSRASRIIENSFGILAARWRIFKRPIIASLETVDKIVLATVCLHNFLKTEEDNLPDSQKLYCPPNFVDCEHGDGVVQPGGWRCEQADGMINIRRTSSNLGHRRAELQRAALTDYFVTPAGELPWQYDCVRQ